MRTRYRAIARLEKSHGRQGEVVAVSVHGLPFLVQEGMRVALVPPAERGSRWQLVSQVSQRQEQSALVAFRDVRDRGAAEALVGKTMLACVDDLPEGFERHDADALLGRELSDGRYGALGQIREVLRTPSNDVWVVEGDYGELLIPVIDDCVGAVEPTGVIEVHLLDGMLDEGACAHAD